MHTGQETVDRSAVSTTHCHSHTINANVYTPDKHCFLIPRILKTAPGLRYEGLEGVYTDLGEELEDEGLVKNTLMAPHCAQVLGQDFSLGH